MQSRFFITVYKYRKRLSLGRRYHFRKRQSAMRRFYQEIARPGVACVEMTGEDSLIWVSPFMEHLP